MVPAMAAFAGRHPFARHVQPRLCHLAASQSEIHFPRVDRRHHGQRLAGLTAQPNNKMTMSFKCLTIDAAVIM